MVTRCQHLWQLIDVSVLSFCKRFLEFFFIPGILTIKLNNGKWEWWRNSGAGGASEKYWNGKEVAGDIIPNQQFSWFRYKKVNLRDDDSAMGKECPKFNIFTDEEQWADYCLICKATLRTFFRQCSKSPGFPHHRLKM